MIPNLSSFSNQSVSTPYEQAQQGIRTLKQLDGTPGDLNKHENAISMKTSLGQLDAVVFSNPDQSQTVIQRLSKGNGLASTTWLEVPPKGNGIPNMTGFEVDQTIFGTSGSSLSVNENYSRGIPYRTYYAKELTSADTQNALLRAEATLSAYPVG